MKNKPETPKVTLKKLTLENFKNFQKAELELGPFTVLVGANATGKSNLREAFRFLHGIGRGYTLPEIIGEKWNSSGVRAWNGMRGGTRELSYIAPPSSKNYNSLSAWTFSLDAQFGFIDEDINANVRYFLKVAFEPFGDILLSTVNEEFLDSANERLFDVHLLQEAFLTEHDFRFVVRQDNGAVRVSTRTGPLTQPMLTTLGKIQEDSITYPPSDSMGTLPRNDSRKTIHQAQKIANSITNFLQSLSFVELRPELMRQAAFPGQSILTESGDNLSSILYTICQMPESKASLLLRLEELTPTEVVDLDFFTDEVGQVRAQLVEKNGRKISVFSASDGTLRLLGTLAALLAPQPANLYFFEELENGIHPTRLHLLTHFIENRVAQSTTQVILTTHSPHLLNFLSPETLENSSLIYRLENEPDAHIKRVMDIPYARELIEKQGIMSLHESGWFETVMSVTNEEETPEPEVAP